MTEPSNAVQPPARPARRPTVLVDFDGVIHQYSRGWDDGTAYDPPMPGAIDALHALDRRGYEVVIFTTRDVDQVKAWLAQHLIPFGGDVTNHKRPAVAMIDDRAIRFDDWHQALTELYVRYPVDSRPQVLTPVPVTLIEQLPKRAPWRCRVLGWHRRRFLERRDPRPDSPGGRRGWTDEYVYECAGCRLRSYQPRPTDTRVEYVRNPDA